MADVAAGLVRWGKYHRGWNAHALQLHLMTYDTACGKTKEKC